MFDLTCNVQKCWTGPTTKVRRRRRWKCSHLLVQGFLKGLLVAGDVFLNLSSLYVFDRHHQGEREMLKMLNLTCDVQVCQALGVTYMDSSNETWDDSPEELHWTWGRYVAKDRALKKGAGSPSKHSPLRRKDETMLGLQMGFSWMLCLVIFRSLGCLPRSSFFSSSD